MNESLNNIIASKINQPYYIEVKIVTGGVLATNANFEIIEEFKKHGFKFKGEPITQTNDDGIAWSFMEKDGGLIGGKKFAVFEKIPMHGKEENGIILAPFKTKGEAEEARKKYGYNTDNYYVDEFN